MYGIIVLLIYALAMISATLLLTKKEKSAEGFFVGNRNMGVLSSAMSIAATWIWAPALFVSAEQAYTNGMPGLFWFLVPNVLCLIFFIPFAKKIRERMPRGITLSGFMSETYKSQKIKRVYLFQLGSLTILSTAVQLLAGGQILSGITGIHFEAITIILSVIAFSYSSLSGIRASIATDMLQMVFILVACFLFVPYALMGDGGIQMMIAGFSGISGEFSSLFDENGLEVFLSFGLPTAIGLISGPFGDQCFWQRAFATSKDKVGKAFFLGAILFGVVPLSMGILGFIAAGSGFIPSNTGVINLELVTHLFPAWATLPFLFMLISGLLSTVDSNLCAVSSLTSDWQVTSKLEMADKIKVSKIFMAVLLILSNLIANIDGLTISHLFLFYGILRATTMLPTAMTIAGKKLTANGVITGVITSLVVGLPVFACGTVLNAPVVKTLGSLLALLLAGIVAVALTNKEERKWKTKH